MYSGESMEENFSALLNLPIVMRLLQKNAKLRKENKALRSLIYSLPEFRCECKSKPVSNTVEVKTEREEEHIPMPCEPLADNDEVVFVSEPEVKKINIIYEIQEEDEAAESEEQEEEEAAESEEEAAESEEEAAESEEEAAESEEEAAESEEEAAESEEEAAESEEEAAESEEEEEAAESEEEEEAAESEEEEEEESADAVDEEEEEEETTDAVEEDEEELFAITVSGKSYYTSDKVNGKIYAIAADEEVGDEIGEFVSGKAKFYKK
jgi:flagellar biosynthesis GTPase FlhF